MLEILLILIVIGVAVYLVNSMIPMAPQFKTLFNVVVTVAVCIWLLRVFGLLHHFPIR